MTDISFHPASLRAARRPLSSPVIAIVQATEDSAAVGSVAMARWTSAVADIQRRHRQLAQFAQHRHQLGQARFLQQQVQNLQQMADQAGTPAGMQAAQLAHEYCQADFAKAEQARQKTRDQQRGGAAISHHLQPRQFVRDSAGAGTIAFKYAELPSQQAQLVERGTADAQDRKISAEEAPVLARTDVELDAALTLQADTQLPQRDAMERQSDRFYRARTVEAVWQGLISCQSAPQWEAPEGDQTIQAIAEKLQPQVREALSELPQMDAAAPDGHYDFYEQLMAMLAGVQGDWLDVNQEVLEKFIAFFNKLNDIMAMLKDAIIGTTSDGNYRVNFQSIVDELNILLSSAASLGLGGGFDEDGVKKFFEDLGRPEGLTYRQASNGAWELAIDPGLIIKIRETFDIGGWGLFPVISPARYQAIIAAKDGFMERFNHISKVLTEKYQRTLQQWDTLVKALSSTIDAVSEADRLFISNMS